MENPYVAEVKLKRLRKYMPVARSHMEGNDEEYVPWTTGVQFEPVFRLGETMMESFSRLERVERLCKKLPGLDCGSNRQGFGRGYCQGRGQRERLHLLSERQSAQFISGDFRTDRRYRRRRKGRGRNPEYFKGLYQADFRGNDLPGHQGTGQGKTGGIDK